MMKRIAILGSTGSIGVSTLDVIARHPDRFEVVALCARSNAQKLAEQCIRFRPRFAVMTEPAAARQLRDRLRVENVGTEVLSSPGDIARVAALAEVDMVMAAIVGAAGLPAVLAAAHAGKTILLANKEALVMSGPLFISAVGESGATLLPIDSEHNAVFQALPRGFERGLELAGVRKIILTASGGPFRTLPAEKLRSVTPEQACAHPNWVMGRKISVDSATMMNKGLEVIEARWLFNALPAQIDVVVHPQSIVHSMVEYRDGSVIAQLGNPDMRTPIACALAYPERIDAGVEPLNLATIGRLDFEAIDDARFPCVRLAYQALKQGGTAATVLNAANEIAVEAFLQRRVAFTAIAEIVERVLDSTPMNGMNTLDDVYHADSQARVSAEQVLRAVA
jgi:1-deoxy-D-xylulose-5-phosphate reductoisomerase